MNRNFVLLICSILCFFSFCKSDDRKDAIIWESSIIEIKSKLDPASVKIYHVDGGTKQYVVFIGKGQSATGSGMQITFFILSELNKKKEIVAIHEFESRFGSINNLFDFKRDGILDYFKVSNGKEPGEYLLTIHNVANDRQVGNGYVLLAYKLNDRFVILEDRLKQFLSEG